MPERRLDRSIYDVQRPPEGYTASIDWVFGSDSYTKQLASRMGFLPSPDELDLVGSMTKRDPRAVDAITEIWGRSAKTPALHPETVFGTVYDTIEIGGFGNQSMHIRGAAGEVDFGAPVTIPSSDNFAASYPSVTHTSIVDAGREMVLGDPFSFTGAYTRKQATRKVAANLFVLNKITNGKDVPFIAPIPFAVGHYPSVTDEHGEPAYFIAFKVPYGGKRTGVRTVSSTDAEGIRRYGEDVLESVPAIAPSLSYISNRWGLTHNQPHPANLYIPLPSEGTKPYLADYSTMYPLNPKKQEKARARELARGMAAIWDTITAHFRNVDERNLGRYVFEKILYNYIGVHVPTAPMAFGSAELFFESSIKVVLDKGVLPANPPGQESWQKILSLEKEINRNIRVRN